MKKSGKKTLRKKKVEKKNRFFNNYTNYVLGFILLILLLVTAYFFMDKEVNKIPQENLKIKEDNTPVISGYPSEKLTQKEIAALELAIMDEYKAKATYNEVIKNLGSVRPFSNIVISEQQHIDILKVVYEKYGLKIPAENIKVNAPDNIKEACSIGVLAEKYNIELYNKLLKDINNKDIEEAFIFLRDASENNHLKAFENCA